MKMQSSKFIEVHEAFRKLNSPYGVWCDKARHTINFVNFDKFLEKVFSG